jgi:hypothetical protein
MAQANLTQIVYMAVRDLGCLRAGQKPSLDVVNDCLQPANDIFEVWGIDNDMIYNSREDTWWLTAGQRDYTIGPIAQADFNAPRPVAFDVANVILIESAPYNHKALNIVNQYEWADITVPDISPAIPQKLFYDRDSDLPGGTSTIHLWPAPMLNYGLQVWTWQQWAPFTDITTQYSFPQAYLYAFRKRLAVEIAPAMKLYAKVERLRQPSQGLIDMLAQQADAVIEKIKSKNIGDIPALSCDPMFTSAGASGSFSYMTGEFSTRR